MKEKKYKVTTKTDKIILCNGLGDLNLTLPKLGDNVRNLTEYSLATKQPKTVSVIFTLTSNQRERYTQRALELGCRSLQEYLKLLLMVDRELKVIMSPKELKGVTHGEDPVEPSRGARSSLGD